jgi:U3 small nucleolar RNA-associated protein 10
MCRDLDLARFIASVLPTSLDTGTSHRSLVALYAGTLAEYINRLKHIDEGVLAFLLPACMRLIAASGEPESKDIVVFTHFSSSSHKCFDQIHFNS